MGMRLFTRSYNLWVFDEFGVCTVEGNPEGKLVVVVTGEALSCRASPIEKQSVELFFNSPSSEAL